jgi:hypothetical protein
MAKTYWRCGTPGCEDNITHEPRPVMMCGTCLRDAWEHVEVHPVGTAAELAELRDIKARLEDEPLTIAPIDAAVWECRQGVADAIDAYRRAVLGKE